jgi:hypothetical protein
MGEAEEFDVEAFKRRLVAVRLILGGGLDRMFAAAEAEDEAIERDRKGRLRWLRADGTRP